MNFADRFKGKVSLVGKEGTLASLDANVKNDNKNGSTVLKSLSQLPPKPSNNNNHNYRNFPTRRNDDSFKSAEAIPHKAQQDTMHSPYLEKINKISETPTIKLSLVKHEMKSNLQQIGYDYICQQYDKKKKYFPSAPNTNLTSGLSSKGMNNLNSAQKKNETEYKEHSTGYKPYTIKEYHEFKTEKYFHMGGLGPNIGGKDWQEKQCLRKEMMDFGTKISLINKGKLMMLPKRITSPKKESKREKAIEYAKRLKQMAQEVSIPSYSKQIEIDLNSLQEQHDALARKIERIKIE